MIHNYATTSEKLKPCPFCRAKPIWYYRKLNKGFKVTIECLTCGVKMEVGTINLSLNWVSVKAEDKWNCRYNKTMEG